MRSTSGITCCHFFCSAVFSMPVCRKPIVGSSDVIVSPSTSSTSRSTPCVLGCWGPMLTVIVSVRMSAIGRRLRLRALTERASVRALHAIVLEAGAELLFADFERRVGLGRLLNLYRIVLALRVAFPFFGHEQAA